MLGVLGVLEMTTNLRGLVLTAHLTIASFWSRYKGCYIRVETIGNGMAKLGVDIVCWSVGDDYNPKRTGAYCLPHNCVFLIGPQAASYAWLLSMNVRIPSSTFCRWSSAADWFAYPSTICIVHGSKKLPQGCSSCCCCEGPGPPPPLPLATAGACVGLKLLGTALWPHWECWRCWSWLQL